MFFLSVIPINKKKQTKPKKWEEKSQENPFPGPEKKTAASQSLEEQQQANKMKLIYKASHGQHLGHVKENPGGEKRKIQERRSGKGQTVGLLLCWPHFLHLDLSWY